MKKNKKKIQLPIRHGFFLTGFFLLSLVFFIITLSATLFLIGVSINILSFIVAFILTFISTYLVATKILSLKPLTTLAIFVIGVLIFSFSILINSITMETTWDGNWYHKSAIGMLKNGWNPVKESATNFYDSDRSPIDTPRAEFQDLVYENHYTKGAWIFSANIYKFTGNIETGHSINLIVAVSVFCLLVALLFSKVSLLASIIISIVVVFNPVMAPQLFLSYNDGLLGLLTVSVIISLIFIISRRDKIYLQVGFIIFFMAATILVNVKFTGLMFLFFYSLAFFIFTLISPELRKNVSKKLFLTGAFTVIFAIFIVGFSPYVSNIKNGLHPLHPLAGKEKIDIMTPNSPKEFADNKKPVVPFIKSLFGKLDSFSYSSGKEVELKIPFTFFESELVNLNTVDARVSGNGIFFSGLFLISVAVIILWLAKTYRSRSLTEFNVFICILVPTALIILIFKEMWWARYLPFLSSIIAMAMYSLLQFKKEVSSMLFYGMFFISLINSYLFFMPNLENGIKIAELANCGDVSRKTEVFYRFSNPSFYGTLFNILDCKQGKDPNFRLLPADQNFNSANYQAVNLVPGYLEVFYEK